MQHGVVLNVAARADDDAVDVPAQDGVVPDAGAVAEGDIAHHDRAAGDINVFAQHRLFAQESAELFVERLKFFHVWTVV
jgi:hypothetical protein